MTQMGLFDITSVVLDPIQTGLSAVLPDVVALAFWAALAAFLSMWVYGKTSNQGLLGKINPLKKAASRRLAVYDGPFDGLLPLIRENLVLSGKHMWLTLIPALLATIPLLFILPWLSNTFGVFFPQAGMSVTVQVESYTPYELHWDANAEFEHTGTGHWTIAWPAAASELNLLGASEQPVLTLPPGRASGILHKRQWWNLLLANPSGYIEPENIVETVYLGLPEREIIPFGPDWMRGWLPVFLVFLFSFSMIFKWWWRLR